MKIEIDQQSSHPHRINAYQQGSIHVGTECFAASLIVTPSLILRNWPPQTFTEIVAPHFDPVLAIKPDLILFGTGRKQLFPPPDIYQAIAAHNIGFEVMDTGAACRSYNLLLEEGRHVAAALLMIGDEHTKSQR